MVALVMMLLDHDFFNMMTSTKGAASSIDCGFFKPSTLFVFKWALVFTYQYLALGHGGAIL